MEISSINYMVNMNGIVKQFPGVLANDNINLDVISGEIHALVGENGAGKSTLMNILYGIYTPDKGKIYVRGKEVTMHAPSVAIKNKIGMIFQHFMLVQPLTVTQNITLGCEMTNGPFLSEKKAIKAVEEICEKYKLKVDPRAKVESISIGMEQKVEIIKTLYKGAELLILDEPTAVLTPQEITELFSTLRALAKQGKTMIIITHKLTEVMEVSDRVSVMRAGRMVDTVPTNQINENELAKMMVGRDVILQVDKPECMVGDTILEVKNLSCSKKAVHGVAGLENINFSIKRGEILGLAGVDGNGQNELFEALTGIRKVKGEIIFKGRSIANLCSRKIREYGVANIPEDRLHSGLIPEYTISENLIMGVHYKNPFSKRGILKKDSINKSAQKLILEYDVRSISENTLVRYLSGGNQQKVIIAREFFSNPDLLIVSQPTRGVDVGSIEFIHKKLISLRNNQKAILLISAELNEIMELSDRIAVMYHGRIVDIVNAKGMTEEKLGLLMAGIKSSNEGRGAGNCTKS